ncbi:MAG: ABC transporter ATP-binding protein [Candidatus Hodarchaeales archaeon]|jgi:ABC-type multidrug transport system ATPase subunit
MTAINNEDSTIVKLRNISRVYGFINALKKINLEIKAGETVGLVGNNGAGKSTLLKIISLLVKPTYGDVELFGNAVKEDTHLLKKEMGILLSSSFFYEDMTGRENLEFFLRMNKRSTDPEKTVQNIVSQFGLKLFIDRPTHELSTGMTKKLEIIRAILPKFPRLLLLDEPFSGLDVENRNFLNDLITEREPNTTVILCSHDFNTVNRLCSKVFYLEKGKILKILVPSEYDYFLNKQK